MKANSLKTFKNPIKEPSEIHKSIIDEYYNNGFNRVKAVRAIKGQDHSYNNAFQLFDRLQNNPRNLPYLKTKREELKAKTDIRNENILRELMHSIVIWCACMLRANKRRGIFIPAPIIYGNILKLSSNAWAVFPPA